MKQILAILTAAILVTACSKQLTIGKKCIEKEIKRDEIKFFYRGTDLPTNFLITSVLLSKTLYG